MKTKSFRCLIFVLASILFLSSCSDDKSSSKKEDSKAATESESSSSTDSSLDDLLDISKIIESLSGDSSSDSSLASILDFIKNMLNSDGDLSDVFGKDVDTSTALVPQTTPSSSSNLLNLQELLNTDDLLNNSSILKIKEVLKDDELSSEELESIKEFLSGHGVNTDHELLTQTERQEILSWIEQNSRTLLNHLSDFGVDLDQEFLMDLADKIFQQ